MVFVFFGVSMGNFDDKHNVKDLKNQLNELEIKFEKIQDIKNKRKRLRVALQIRGEAKELLGVYEKKKDASPIKPAVSIIEVLKNFIFGARAK